ncbi:unnamed protein product [Heligmosomoides polygyrus]|uniref:PB602L n=1 Tax=Heligmosomoides polygyrus TaxID=6339 RepID=A0A183FBV2_HELPZ|nr:unnamed protein product [Heligmosomoides polygyrus]
MLRRLKHNLPDRCPSSSRTSTPSSVLYRRIEKFIYDADNDRTFDVCYKRFKDVFDNDCGDLDDKEKTRLLVSLLDEGCHQLLCGSISPMLPSDLTWDEAIGSTEVHPPPAGAWPQEVHR